MILNFSHSATLAVWNINEWCKLSTRTISRNHESLGTYMYVLCMELIRFPFIKISSCLLLRFSGLNYTNANAKNEELNHPDSRSQKKQKLPKKLGIYGFGLTHLIYESNKCMVSLWMEWVLKRKLTRTKLNLQ